MADALQPDLKQAAQFLKRLDPTTEEFTFQVLDDDQDRKTKHHHKVYNGTLKSLAQKLTAHNRNGAGIFVTINKTDLKGRQTNNIQTIRAVWQEDDNGGEHSFPTTPHMTIESSPGKYHRYFITDASDLFPLEGVELAAEFKPVEKRLVNDYGSDSGAADIARVLRVPGFFHQKKSKSKKLTGKPVMVKILDISDKPPIPWSELISLFPPVENTITSTVSDKEKDPFYGFLNDEQIADLNSAMEFLATSPLSEKEKPAANPKDEYWLDVRANYIHTAHLLKPCGDIGKEIWLSAIKLSDRNEGNENYDCEKWEGAKPSHAGYEKIFKIAQQRGWKNPRSKGTNNKKSAYSDIGLICLDDVEEKPISWLWHKRIALGKVTMLAGDPGLGKSMLTVALAAHVTTGKAWPVEKSPCPQGEVILVGAEDALDDTVKPRLVAAGANIKRVHSFSMVKDTAIDGTISMRPFSLKEDLELLTEVLKHHGECKLIVIDPITAFLGSGTDSHNNAEVRALLHPLTELAEKYGIAIICVSHLNKSGGGNSSYRVMGSLAFVAAARASFLVARDPQNPEKRLFLAGKNNIGTDSGGYSYTIKETDKEVPYIVWNDEAENRDANEVLGESPKKRSALDDTKDWLEENLCFGAIAVKELRKQAGKDGYPWRTVERAKKEMRVESKRVCNPSQGGKGDHWEWSLPENTAEEEAA